MAVGRESRRQSLQDCDDLLLTDECAGRSTEPQHFVEHRDSGIRARERLQDQQSGGIHCGGGRHACHNASATCAATQHNRAFRCDNTARHHSVGGLVHHAAVLAAHRIPRLFPARHREGMRTAVELRGREHGEQSGPPMGNGRESSRHRRRAADIWRTSGQRARHFHAARQQQPTRSSAGGERHADLPVPVRGAQCADMYRRGWLGPGALRGFARGAAGEPDAARCHGVSDGRTRLFGQHSIASRVSFRRVRVPHRRHRVVEVGLLRRRLGAPAVPDRRSLHPGFQGQRR